MIKEFPVPCGTNEAIVMVHSYHKGELQGHLVHPRLPVPQEVRTLSQLILLLDEILLKEDGEIYRNPFTSAEYDDDQCIAILRIRILFRDHHTWQGNIGVEGTVKKMPFRSVLELIRQMDALLNE